jgi:hypothetical protein
MALPYQLLVMNDRRGGRSVKGIAHGHDFAGWIRWNRVILKVLGGW